jgi:hypothetical protein
MKIELRPHTGNTRVNQAATAKDSRPQLNGATLDSHLVSVAWTHKRLGKQSGEVRLTETRRSVMLQIELVAIATPTTAATAPAPAKIPTPAAAAAAGRTILPRTGHIDGDRAAPQVAAVQSGDGALRLFGRTHGHKPKTARAVGHAIHHQIGFDHRAKGRERVLQVVLRGLKRKISYE